MRQTISGLIAAIAVMTAAPAFACGGYGGCSPCGYVSTCGGVYERLPDPVVQYQAAPVALPQYYYVDQGPTYTGPGNFAPRRVYREEGISDWRAYHRRVHHYRYGYAGRWYPHRHHYAAPYRYGYHYRPHVLHSYY
jgi:hypothetical protein